MKKFKKISNIKVGAVGYGASFMIARQHLNEMKRAGMTLTCVTDIDKSRLSLTDDEDIKCVIFMMFDAIKAAVGNTMHGSPAEKERASLYRKIQIIRSGASA